jgi:hypothetical protein
LLYFAGFHSPVFDDILRPDVAIKKRREWIVESEIPLDSVRGVISIAILASIQAAIVHADIDAGHATAFFSLILIFGRR